eukprot:COSAG04_NODE_10979_length_739_cov_2.093750_1_plen_103_part_10
MGPDPNPTTASAIGPATMAGLEHGPLETRRSDFLCDQAKMLSIRPEDFKDMVRAGAKAASARGANDAREATPQTGPQGPPPNGREEADELSAARQLSRPLPP